MRNRRSLTAGATLGAVAVLTTGCLGGGGGGGGSDNTSRNIEVMFGFTAGSKQESGFREEVDAWAAENDVEIEYTQTGSFDQLINTRVQGNDPPDIAIFPQPGIMQDFAEEDRLADLTDIIPQENLDSLIEGALETGQVDGTQYAVPVSINVKSIVFHPPEFTDEYEVPETLDDLVALSDEIAQGGETAPWCFGIESEAATGWPATDWVENLILIQQGSDYYNQWVDHEVPFTSPEVQEALETMEQLLLEEGKTNGGRRSIAASGFLTAGNPLFDDPPGCYMYRQGNFVADEGGFPEDVLANLDEEVGVFPMPGETPEEKPVLGGGDLAGIFSQENEAAQELLQFLTSPEFGTNGYGETGAWISPNTEFDTGTYPSETVRTIAEIAYQSTEFVFDGSDQMPGEVGAGSFWREMVNWISGGQDIEATLENIESSWPA